MVGPNLPFGGLAYGLVLGSLPSGMLISSLLDHAPKKLIRTMQTN